ncbi:MAG: hypothetical protein KDD48_08505 [Bdellovibrionales bacterium]|nr:hypothetical protein [Bdellovibrionales bacterium]
MKRWFPHTLYLFIFAGFLFGNLSELEGMSKHFNNDNGAQAQISSIDDAVSNACDDCTDCAGSAHCSHHCNGLHIVVLSSVLNHPSIPASSLANQDIQEKPLSRFLEVAGQPPQFLLV